MTNKMKKVLFLGCNTDQLGYLTELTNRNYYIVGIDQNMNAPGKNLCDAFYNFGYDNVDALIDVGASENFKESDHIFTAAAQFANLGASAFANRFGISFPSRNSIETCLDKTKFYDSFAANELPIPATRKIKDENDLQQYLEFSSGTNFYLKSDFSKNPNYVYKFNKNNIPWNIFCWDKDRYFQEHYVIQEEFLGRSIRINIYGDRYNIFDFETSNHIKSNDYFVINDEIIPKLQQFRNFHNMQNWVLKFDVISADQEYVVLDVGMDPPSRMYKLAKEHDIDFESHYLNQYLNGDVTFPKELDS